MVSSELGLSELAQAIAAGELTSEALAEELLARCARASALNAFISLEPERVRAAARDADRRRRQGGALGPLHGVPVAVKDNIDSADYPTTAGTPALAAHRPRHNATVLQRLLDVGPIVLGKANLQELAYGPTSNNAAFGAVRNPYDPTRIPGGSSGGSASLCGVTSFRPSSLRWPQDGIVPISHTRDTAAPMARKVADCVLLDGVVTGGRRQVASADLRGLRLGVPRGFFWESLDAEVAAILESVLTRLRDAGAILVEGDVADVQALDAAAGFPIALYEFVPDLDRYLAAHALGLDFAAVVAKVASPMVTKLLAGLTGTDKVPEAAYRDALTKHVPALQETYRRYFRDRGVAAMVFPTTPRPAARIGDDDTVMLNGAPVSTFGTFIRNLTPGSAAGLPGLSLPAGMTRAGLPVGIAIDGPQQGDRQILAIAAAIEAVLPGLPPPAV